MEAAGLPTQRHGIKTPECSAWQDSGVACVVGVFPHVRDKFQAFVGL
jgi:hypothetical protein